jgi:hypothetical protein
LKVLRKPEQTDEQTADPRRNQRRNHLCHPCLFSKISQVLKDKNEAQRFLQYHFTKTWKPRTLPCFFRKFKDKE